MKKQILAVMSAVAITLFTGCSTANNADGNASNVIQVMAGSEVKDMEPLFSDLKKETGVEIRAEYVGTISGIDKIEGEGDKPDAAWFAQNHYFQLVDDKHMIKEAEKIMISPVVLGVKHKKAQELGWKNGTTNWKDVQSAIAAGKFHYAMTSPTTSNSGFSAVIGVTTAFSGTGDAAKTKDVDAKRLTSFFSGQKIFSGSSGWLADAYINGESDVDGIINYESVILEMKDKVKEPLDIIAPKDGTLIADYPLTLINPAKKQAYDKVVAWLKTPKIQERIMRETKRRPLNGSIPLDQEFGGKMLVDTPFPGSRSTIDAMLLAYLNKHRVAAHAIFVLDKTGSMRQEDGTGQSRLGRVQDAIYVLTGSDKSLTGKFAKFDNREKITIITFSEQPEIDQTFTMKKVDDPDVFGKIRKIADSMSADGGTAIYDALERGLDEAEADGDNTYDSVVLMTDGENNRGENQDDFLKRYAGRKKHVRVFAIGIGESNAEELGKITAATGGKYFDGRKGDLASIFKEMRGYQ